MQKNTGGRWTEEHDEANSSLSFYYFFFLQKRLKIPWKLIFTILNTCHKPTATSARYLNNFFVYCQVFNLDCENIWWSFAKMLQRCTCSFTPLDCRMYQSGVGILYKQKYQSLQHHDSVRLDSFRLPSQQLYSGSRNMCVLCYCNYMLDVAFL